MKILISYIILCFLFIHIIKGQNELITLRTAFVVNRSSIIDNDSGFYFENDLDPSTLYELTYSWSDESWIYEAGFGFMEIISSIAFRHDFDRFGFGRGASGETYNYFYFPLRLKRKLDIANWFAISPGIETSLMFVTEDNFLLGSESGCFDRGEEFLNCRITDDVLFHQPAVGVGINLSLDFNVSRFGVSIFGKRDWRSQKGHGLSTTTQIRRKNNNEVVDEHMGFVRSSLHTWNIGIGASYRL